jgi:hypothetical protein|tara:strand:- start:12660 stop:13313 length:654 start_codon:yes stop_codon:yes gene_type:complete
MSKNIKHSPLKFIGPAIQYFGARSQKGKTQGEERRAQEEYDEMRGRYLGLDTSNLYSDVSNPYANMENVYEDLTVNQQEARFIQQQQQQQQANIMQQMGGAAGGSGIAGLAQAMANQGTQQAQQAAASIGKQEQATQMAAARGAESIQTLERQGGWKADMTRRAGAEQSRELEGKKTRALYAMATGRLTKAKQAEQARMDAQWGAVGDAFSLGGIFS